MLISQFSYETESKIEEMKLGKRGEMDTDNQITVSRLKTLEEENHLGSKNNDCFFHNGKTSI